MAKMQENTDRSLGLTSDEIINECMVLSAVESTELALASGLRPRPDRHLLQGLAAGGSDRDLPLTRHGVRLSPCISVSPRAGMGMKGMVWSASAMGVLLNEGIGDTIRVSLTPRPGGDRREEVYAACELLQALGLRSFAPSVTACPGCGRTTSTTFQELAERIQDHVRARMPEWKARYEGVEDDDGRGDGVRGQRPRRVEGRQHRHQSSRDGRGAPVPRLHRRTSCHEPSWLVCEELSEAFRTLVDQYVEARYRKKVQPETVETR